MKWLDIQILVKEGKHKVLKIYILPSLITVKEPPGVARTCSVKKLFLEMSQDSQEKTCARVFFLIKLPRPVNLLKKRLWHRRFPVNSEKFLRTTFFIERLCWLLLKNLWNILWWSQFLQLNFILKTLKAVLILCCETQYGITE